jgi:hypothetical protein
MSKEAEVISHRSFVFEGFNTTVSTFYSVVESMLLTRAIPGARVSRVFMPEGGIGSAKREYLRVRRGAEVFDVMAAAIGNSFMISHWLRKIPRHRGWIKWVVGFFLVLPFIQVVSTSLNEKVTGCCAMVLLPFFVIMPVFWFLRIIPGAGLFFRLTRAVFGWGWKVFRLPTLFQSDAAALFRSTVPTIVEQAIQAIRSGQTFLEEKPRLQVLAPIESE